MSSFSKSILLSIGAMTSPLTSAFLTPSTTTTTTPRSFNQRLHFYLPEDGGYGGEMNGYPGGPHPMEQHSQYGPPPEPDFETMVYGPAVGCANNPGMCDIDELMGLARELEEFQECYIDMGPESCEHEIADRHMLASALYSQSETMQFQGQGMGQPGMGQGPPGMGQQGPPGMGQQGPPGMGRQGMEMDMGRMPFGEDQMMQNNGYPNNDQRMHNGYADHDQRMHDDSRYQNRAMPNSGKK